MVGKGFLGRGGGGISELDTKELPIGEMILCGYNVEKLWGPNENEGMVLWEKENELGLVKGWLRGPIGGILVLN